MYECHTLWVCICHAINQHIATMNHSFSLLEVAKDYCASRMSNTLCMEENNVCIHTYYVN